MGSVNDESWVTETTFEIGGTQLYANNTALGIDGNVYDRSIGLLIFPTQPLITPSTSAYMHRLIALVHEHRC